MPADRATATATDLAACLARIPQYASVGDVEAAFPSRDALIDAYAEGRLPSDVAGVLEAWPERLSCWLLARLLRLQLRERA